MVVVPVVMPVVVIVRVVVVMLMFRISHHQAAGAGAEVLAEVAILDIRARRRGALALDVVVVAFLGQADLGLETEHLGAVFAHLAVHCVFAGDDFTDSFSKGGDHLWMIVQIAGRPIR